MLNFIFIHSSILGGFFILSLIVLHILFYDDAKRGIEKNDWIVK